MTLPELEANILGFKSAAQNALNFVTLYNELVQAPQVVLKAGSTNISLSIPLVLIRPYLREQGEFHIGVAISAATTLGITYVPPVFRKA